VLKAYRRALDHRPDYVLQVDGDGQFFGSDLRRLLVLLIENFSFGVSARDPNCPLRGGGRRRLTPAVGGGGSATVNFPRPPTRAGRR
jgi:hypothetical protein